MVSKLAEEDDAALVARCLGGETPAWGVLTGRYQRLVYAIVMRMGLDEHTAADVFQTVFVRLLQQLPRIAEPQRLQAWIVTTAKREGLLVRQRARRNESLTRSDAAGGEAADLEFEDDSPIPEAQLADLQQQHQVRLALERLDGRCRALLQLLFGDEDERLGYDEVSRRLAIPVGSIGPTRSRCLGKLRKLVD